MILSRIAEHLKRQNWTAVAIEFLIVVIGVFIGTNVTNWNDARIQRERSATYTARLLQDLRVEYEYALQLRDYARTTIEAGKTAFDGLSRAKAYDDRTVLVAAYRATQYQWYERHRAAYDELVSSGKLDLITDPALRETAVRFYGNSNLIYQIVQDDSRDSRYRTLVFRLIDPEVELALRHDCGDRPATTSGGLQGVFTLDYPCTLAKDDAAVAKAVAALRSEPELLPALRQQTATYDVQIANLDYMLGEAGIAALFAKGAATAGAAP